VDQRGHPLIEAEADRLLDFGVAVHFDVGAGPEVVEVAALLSG